MRSMKRPSRRLRESVATMLKNGRFLAPPRAKRITTIIVPKSVLRRKKAANYSAPDRVSASDTCVIGRSWAIGDYDPIRAVGQVLPAKKSAPDHALMDDTACFPGFFTVRH